MSYRNQYAIPVLFLGFALLGLSYVVFTDKSSPNSTLAGCIVVAMGLLIIVSTVVEWIKWPRS